MLAVSIGILSYSLYGIHNEDEEETHPIFIESTPYGDLYREDLKNGPLYYYQQEIDGRTVIKIVAFATVTLNVDV